MSLCAYKDLLGKPKEGIHSYRIFNIAVVDLLLTVIAAYVVSKYFSLNYFSTLAILLLIGAFLHCIFCVKTTTNVFFQKMINKMQR